MRPTAPCVAAAAFAVLGMFGTGCVQQDRYDSLLTSNRSLQEQLVAAEDERDVAVANLDTARAELGQARTDVNRLRNQNGNLRSELDGMGSDYDELLGRVSDLKFGPLPRDVESALNALSRAHPDMLAFDAQNGMLRFSSDLTFGLGSTALTENAARTLAKLGQILSSSTATQLEVRIVGHTDNVPIGKPETRAKHPTNVHLSVHRAISVRDHLAKAGVAPQRMQVAGHGPHRPIVANGRRGAAENRRVEILLAPLPADIDGSTIITAAPTDTAESKTSRTAAVHEPNK